MGLDPQQLNALQSREASPEAPLSSQEPAQPQTIHAKPAQQETSQDGPAPAASISLEAEVPELLYQGMRQFISNHPHWDQYRLVTSALANFLFQNGCTDQTVTKHYLNDLFLKP